MNRSVRLVRVAAQAEGLRLRRHGRRLVVRAALGAVACLFAVLALAVAHIAGFLALLPVLSRVPAALVVLGVDVVIALVLGFLATRGGADEIEREAREVRDRALEQLKEKLAFFTLFAPLSRMMGKRGVYGMTLAALTARFLSGR
jgi:hypothetical protein